jgi:ribonucleoside-diphosphate reductase alpha chain
MPEIYGPQTPIGQLFHGMKYRGPDEKFDDYAVRYCRTVASDDPSRFRRTLGYVRDQSILPGGRQQLAVGRPQQTTAFQCFVMPDVPDSTRAIFDAVGDAAMTLRAGGGIGMNFSTLRPAGEPIRGLGFGAFASGPISFMRVWDAMSTTICSAGERRGAMMGVLRVDHPNILEFVRAKQDGYSLIQFNLSVLVTDEFMEALAVDGSYPLRFGDTVFGYARAFDVWSAIMENNWDWAEPGVIFIDRVNRLNPLYYCERISATNPCAEQPLPPYGACLLGSLNLVKFIQTAHDGNGVQLASQSGVQVQRYEFDYERLRDATDCAVRAFDAVIDRTTFPLEQQRQEALQKRRMGVGITGTANAGSILGHVYGSAAYLDWQDAVLECVATQAYRTSTELAREKGPFPLFDADKYLAGEFVRRLPEDVVDGIRRHGLRNGTLTSIAPTGTISLVADNISSGIEPVFAHRVERVVKTPEGAKTFQIIDYASNFYGVDGRTASEVSPEEHIDVLCRAQRRIDSSISKTCNVNGQVHGQGPGVTFNDFKDLYLRAYEGGAKSCSTFNLTGKRGGIMQAVKEDVPEGGACFVDPDTGERACAD